MYVCRNKVEFCSNRIPFSNDMYRMKTTRASHLCGKVPFIDRRHWSLRTTHLTYIEELIQLRISIVRTSFRLVCSLSLRISNALLDVVLSWRRNRVQLLSAFSRKVERMFPFRGLSSSSAGYNHTRRFFNASLQQAKRCVNGWRQEKLEFNDNFTIINSVTPAHKSSFVAGHVESLKQ